MMIGALGLGSILGTIDLDTRGEGEGEGGQETITSFDPAPPDEKFRGLSNSHSGDGEGGVVLCTNISSLSGNVFSPRKNRTTTCIKE